VVPGAVGPKEAMEKVAGRAVEPSQNLYGSEFFRSLPGTHPCAASLLFAHLVTLRVRFVVFTVPPPVAIRVRVETETWAVDPRVRVSLMLPFPGAATLPGARLTVTPAGRPETESAMEELKPPRPRVVRATDPLAPGARETLPGLAARVKVGTLSLVVCERVMPPRLAAITMV